MKKIDLNCDLGESFGSFKIGSDEEIMAYITSANIACGFHAGDPGTMRRTVKLALQHGTAIGAHPGLPDLQGFGRRKMEISPEEAFDLVLYQIGALSAFVKAEGGRLSHVKPHGALYNMCAGDKRLAEAVARAVQSADEELVLFGLHNSESTSAAERIGIRAAQEVFADRRYEDDGTLVSRSSSDALITTAEEAVGQVLRMVLENKTVSRNGKEIMIKADTICLHGDGLQALEFAATLHAALKGRGVEVASFT
ncbi:LamB/YcsF family protein [Bacillus infantis]|uniref:LamB/YcsF family protein n=1 Tax=Bacillus infantis TaxID=324767 RepID=UPI0020054C15|nr:5-oxoprolinase subunit PxpA [Bacillus infantis]MCK6205336.1 LamB/YcsF family protein [Bacillus infantis]MCP1158520.1 LamB/YcsF family protein [Bacillus infantis]